MPLKPPDGATDPILTWGSLEDRLEVLEESPIIVEVGDSIQDAITLASTASKGRVYIRPGTHSVATTNLVSAVGSLGLEIFGDSEKTLLQMANTAELICFDITNLADRVTIRDLYIKGSVPGGLGNESHGIRYQDNANFARVYRVRLDSCAGDGIRFLGSLAGKIEDCFITDIGLNGVSLLAGSSQIANANHVLDNWIQSCTGNGIYADRVESPRLVGNRLEVNGNSGAGGNGCGNMYLFETLYPMIRENYFENGGDFEFRYGDGGGGFAVDGTLIDNEFIADLAISAAPITVWLETCYRMEMSMNKFSSALASVVNLQCDAATRDLVLRKHHWANASGVTFADYRNTLFVEPSNLAVPSVASAVALLPPMGFPIVNVTGTTGPITSIANPGGDGIGVMLTLRFTDATPPQVTDGGNIQLAGNYVTTQNDTLTLKSGGANWYEVCRSGNI